MYLLITYILIKIFYGTDKINNFFLSIGNLLKNKKYPGFKKAEDFNTPKLHKQWWDELDEEWRMVFRFQVYPKFDCTGKDIANYVLDLKHLNLNLRGITNLNGLNNLSNLNSLTISNYDSVNLSCLKKLNNLTKLEISNSNFSSRIPIGAISNIVALKFENCQIRNLGLFKYLKNLKQLSLEANNIQDISCLKEVTQLEFLSLQNNPITDFSALTHLTNTTIELSFNQKFNLKELQENNIQVIITFNNNFHQYDETFFQNN
jgi:hypothetical protein